MAEQYYATGRRKTSSARVFLSTGAGEIEVNGKPLDTFFSRKTAQMIVRQPLELMKLGDQFNVNVKVTGGGTTGQAGAIRHGLTRNRRWLSNQHCHHPPEETQESFWPPFFQLRV